MTIAGLLASLAWAAVIVYGVRCVDRRVDEWIVAQRTRAECWSREETMRARLRATARVKIAREREAGRVRAAEVASGRVDPTVPLQITLPDDLEAYANEWRDQFAREDTRSMLKQKFLELHTGNAEDTWQAVRRSVGIGEMPTPQPPAVPDINLPNLS